MCNCGKKRMELQRGLHQAVSPREMQQVKFEYLGKTSLRITGNATKKTYRFDFPGAVQEVFNQDVPYLLLCPLLKRTGF